MQQMFGVYNYFYGIGFLNTITNFIEPSRPYQASISTEVPSALCSVIGTQQVVLLHLLYKRLGQDPK